MMSLFSGAQGAERCLKEGEAPDRGFSLSYTQGALSDPPPNTHTFDSPCLFAVQLTLSSGVLRIYGNCTVLLNYCPWMKSSSKQGKLLTWMKRRWLRLTYDVFLVVKSACYCNQLYNALHVSDYCWRRLVTVPLQTLAIFLTVTALMSVCPAQWRSPLVPHIRNVKMHSFFCLLWIGQFMKITGGGDILK